MGVILKQGKMLICVLLSIYYKHCLRSTIGYAVPDEFERNISKLFARFYKGTPYRNKRLIVCFFTHPPSQKRPSKTEIYISLLISSWPDEKLPI